jgi:hypothetical protein
MTTVGDDPGRDSAPVCAACSKPITSKAAVVVEQGELYHTYCRNRLTRLKSLDLVDRAQRHVAEAEDLAARGEAIERSRWLVILAWAYRHLAQELETRFQGRARVIVDRRDRPGTGSRMTWPGQERRRPLTPPEIAMWRDFGFRMVYRDRKAQKDRD